MRLQCEVEVVSRLLPSCGLRGRGRGTRALLSLGRPPGGARGGSVYLMVCTARDRGGARYKVQENVERFFTRFVEEGKATVRLREPAVDICLSKVESCSTDKCKNNKLVIPRLCFSVGKCQQFKEFPFSCETGSPRDQHQRSPTLSSGTSEDFRS
uniref:PIF1/LRR1 pleckstrin homology domain-containing protein n=1 Tax=Anser brachyrhynchus TaxID=132585 RepID=A0A8B9C884_9AVES